MALPRSASRRLSRFPDAFAWGLVALFVVLAVVKLSQGFRLLLLGVSGGAFDLGLRLYETQNWFAGHWVGSLVYPPASQALLWPAVGWLPFREARGLWALLSLGCLAWLSWLCARECGLRSAAGRIACALLPLAASATSSAVGIGQIVPLFLPVVATAVLCMARGPSRWADSAGAALLFTIASVKPTLFAPFAWLVLLLPRSRRPAALAAALYLVLTLVALAAIRVPTPDDGVTAALRFGLERKIGWATTPQPGGTNAVVFAGGYGNLQNMSQEAGLVGLENFVLPVASVLACGAWLLRRRRTDPWILLGVCALAARLGWYHRFYDDMLLVFPAIALVRIFASGSEPGGADPRTSRTAAVLLALTLAHLLSPGGIDWQLREKVNAIATAIWILDLAFLARVAPVVDRRRDAALPAAGIPRVA